MAESTQTMEEELSCSICVDIFREPVSLPCHHSFCRECLRLFAEKAKSDESEDKTSSSHPHEINCPMCRSPTVLTLDGVSTLPVDTELCVKIEEFKSTVRAKDDTPLCSMCEDTSPSPATMFCSTCDVYFCQDCLATMHPTRGPFKRHAMKPANEIFHQKVTESHEMTAKRAGSDSRPACDKHSQPLCIYCVTCKTVICLGCIVEHPEHSSLDIETASHRDKAMLGEKTGHLTNLVEEIRNSLSEFEQLERDIKTNQDLHTSDIERAYTAALNALNSWKKTSLEAVRRRYSDWSLKCSATNKDLEMKLEELELTQKSCQKLLSGLDVEFLQGSQQLTKRIEDQLRQTGKCVRDQEEVKQKLEKCVKGDPDLLRHVIVKEGPRCAKPDLKFITDNDSMVKCRDLSKGEWDRAVTDGRLQTGRHYWELEIYAMTSSACPRCYCCVGVVMESSCLTLPTPGSDAWFIAMNYCNNKVSCFSVCGGDATLIYQQERPHTGRQHLGLFLDCDDRSLTVVDCDDNRIIHTVKGVNLSRPLVPFISFEGFKWATARLVAPDSLVFPQVLCNMLNAN